MKGSDKVDMTINISGELIKINVPFDEQNDVRDTERDLKHYIEKLRNAWPDNSDKNILAMAAYQYAKWCRNLVKIQEETIELISDKCQSIDKILEQNKN